MKKKNAQNLLEYALILALIAVVGAAFVMKFDLKKIRNYVFNRPASTGTVNGVTGTRINIEPMTGNPN